MSFNLAARRIGVVMLAFCAGAPGALEAHTLPASVFMADSADAPAEGMPVQSRQDVAQKVFREHPDLIPVRFQQDILAGRVVLGMTPYAADLAGGAFDFRIVADEKNWRPGADPYDVMRSQGARPDDSQIWMTFRNDTQYPGDGATKFRVFIKGGKVLEIEKLPN
jgi:hypothetical protein